MPQLRFAQLGLISYSNYFVCFQIALAVKKIRTATISHMTMEMI